MKLQTPPKQKAAAAAVLTLTVLVAVFCLYDPTSPQSSPSPSESAPASASPSPSEKATSDALELEEHGYFIDSTVNKGPLPNRQAPRRAYRSNEDGREYSKSALDEVVQTILSSITTPNTDKAQQCNEIYYYVKGCISYGGISVKSDWRKAAYWGFTTGTSDDFTFYACSRALLEGAGFQVKEVKREGGDLTEAHSWCLVNYNDGWYHFDPFPHLKSDPVFNCCLASDQQLANFDAGAGRDYYAFDEDAYPERAGGRADPAFTVPMPRPEGYEDLKSQPTKEPTPSAVPSPSPEPSVEVTPTPSASPTAAPQATATPSSTPSASAEPEETPSASPSPASTESPAPTPMQAPAETPIPTAAVPSEPPVDEEPLLPPGA